MAELQNLTYNQLLTALPSYLQRPTTDLAFASEIPRFIMLAENRIATDMKQQGFQSVVVGTLPLGPSLAKPAWWRETISFTYKKPSADDPSVLEATPLYLRPLEYVNNYWPNVSATAAPKFYADYNIANFKFVPTPDAQYQFELVYYARLQPLSVDNQTNWMTLNVPQALLYASLLEAALWVGNESAIAKWQGQYEAAKASIIGENQERMADRNEAVARG